MKFTIEQHATVPFEDMRGLVQSMSRLQTVWSWGAHAWTNLRNKALRFRVRGHHFKGWVIIAPNNSDLFNIYYVNLANEIKMEDSNIFVDDLIRIIDERVEKIPEYVR